MGPSAKYCNFLRLAVTDSRQASAALQFPLLNRGATSGEAFIVPQLDNSRLNIST